MSYRTLLRVCSLFLLPLALFCERSWGSALSLEGYRSCIQEALSRAEAGKAPLISEESVFFDERFPPHLEVNTKSGEPVQVDNGQLLRLVKESWETDQGREALLAHLKALRSQISFVDQSLPLSEFHVTIGKRNIQILRNRQVVQQVILLKDKTDVALVQFHASLGIELVDRLFEEEEFSLPTGIEHSQDAEQR